MKQQPAPWYYYICWSNRSPLCYRESLCVFSALPSMNCCVSLLLCEGASWTSLCWSIIWVYWSSWRTGRCRLRSLQQVITSPWRNTGMVLPRWTGDLPLVCVFHHVTCLLSLQCQVLLVQRAAERRQRSEQNERVAAVGAAGEQQQEVCLNLFAASHTRWLSLCVLCWTESVRGRGGEWTSGWSAAGGCFSSEETTKREEAEQCRKRFVTENSRLVKKKRLTESM